MKFMSMQSEWIKMSKSLNERIWLSVFLVLFLYVIVLYVPQIIMGSVGIKAPVFDIINLVIYFLFWFLIVPFGMRIPRKVASLKEYLSEIMLSKTKPLGLLTFLGILIGVIYLLGIIVYTAIRGSLTPNIENILPPGNWILLYGNIGAFFEEVAIRGVILILLLKRYSWKKAILFSSLIFGLGHIITFFLGGDLFSSVTQVIYAFCLGILFATLVIKTNSLLPGIIAHIIINSLSGIFSGALDVRELAYALLFSSILTLALGLIILKYIPGGNDKNTVVELN